MRKKYMNVLNLIGISNHGKNRIREQGSKWIIQRIEENLPCKNNNKARLLKQLDGELLRLVQLNGDEDFGINEAEQ